MRVVAAALLAPIAVTLYLTFSRGAIWVLPIGFVLYVLLAQPRGLVTAALAAGSRRRSRSKVAYGAELLARADYDTSAAAARQARHVGVGRARRAALAAAALRCAARPLDRRLERIEIAARGAARCSPAACWSRCSSARRWPSRAAADRRRPRDVHARAATWPTRRPAHAADLGGRQRARSTTGASRSTAFDASSRCTAPAPGTYRITWDRDRPAPPVKVNDGHSLYLETLSELGIVGLVLLLTALGTLLVGGLRAPRAARSATPTARSSPAGRCSRSTRAIDWDWEMPALFVWLFGAGGVVLAARAAAARRARAARRAIVAALAVLVLAMTPALFALLAGAARPRRRRVRRPRLPDGDRRRADRHRALRHAAGAVAGARLLRRAARPVRARPARDGRRPRARPEQLAARLRAGDRLRRLRAGPAARTPARRCG